MSLPSRQIRLIAEYTGRFSLRSGTGLVFLLVALVTGLLIAHIVIGPIEHTQDELHGAEEGEAMEMILDAARPAVTWLVGRGAGDDASAERWAGFLLDDRPALLSAILLITLFVWPFLVALGAFNQFSGDVGSRRIRYLLLRVPRSRLYAGRFLGTLAFVLATLVLILAIVLLYLGFSVGLYGWGELVGWAAWGLLALALVTIPYVALCAWLSTLIDSPFGSLSVAAIVVGGIPLMALLGGTAWEPIGWLRYAIPWGVQPYLMHYSWAYAAGAAAACVAYTALFAALGHRYFVRRDL